MRYQFNGFTRAIDLSPNDPQLWAFISYGALAQIFSQDYKAAIEWADRASSIPNCQYWASSHKLVACAYLISEKKLNKPERTYGKTHGTVNRFTHITDTIPIHITLTVGISIKTIVIPVKFNNCAKTILLNSAIITETCITVFTN